MTLDFLAAVRVGSGIVACMGFSRDLSQETALFH